MERSEFCRIRDRIAAGEENRLIAEAGGRSWIRRFVPGARLILLGGGHVAKAVCAFAARLDFAVSVCDDRPAFANSERFPDAERVICDSFEAAIRSLKVRPSDYVCVMTRGHRWDRECLETILTGPLPRYLGMVGSHRRTAGLKQALLEAGFSRAGIEGLHAPIGLPIGAVTPEEIAVSICAELIRERHEADSREEDVLEQTLADPVLLDFLAGAEQPRALMLVLSATGSTPSKPGALMALDRLGTALGTVGGGCAEAAAMAQARRLIGTGGQKLLTVDLSNKDAAREGLVCGGTLTILAADVTG